MITSSRISLSPSLETAGIEQDHFHRLIGDKIVHEIDDFVPVMEPPPDIQCHEKTRIVAVWLNRMFGKT